MGDWQFKILKNPRDSGETQKDACQFAGSLVNWKTVGWQELQAQEKQLKAET